MGSFFVKRFVTGWRNVFFIFVVWTPVYLLSNSSVNEVENLTFAKIVPALSYVGTPDEEIENKIKILNSLNIRTNKGLLDALNGIDGVNNIEIQVVNTEKAKLEPQDLFYKNLNTVELKFNGKNNTQYKIEFLVLDKDYIPPEFSKFFLITSMSDSILGEYSNTTMWDFFGALYKENGANLYSDTPRVPSLAKVKTETVQAPPVELHTPVEGTDVSTRTDTLSVPTPGNAEAQIEPIQGSDLPLFKENESYANIRSKMIDSGWTPFHSENAETCSEGDSRCEGRPEMESCAGTGMANCKFLWKKNEKTTAICTAGEDTTFDGVCN